MELRAGKIFGRLKVGSQNERGEYWTIPGEVQRAGREGREIEICRRENGGKGVESCQCFKVDSHPHCIVWRRKLLIHNFLISELF